MYIRKTIHTGETIEVEEYFSNRIGYHDKRARKEKPTAKQVREAYLRRREKHIRWLMNLNFQDGKDALVTFSWRAKSVAPVTLAGVKHAAGLLIRRLREEYACFGIDLKYIYCVEIGPRGSRHIHMLLSGAGELPAVVLCRCWDGVVDIKPLHTQGRYDAIASYFVKDYAEKTSRTTGEEIKRCFECSRNLKKPLVEIERIREKDIRKDITPPEGTVLDRSSVVEGIGKLYGRPYRFYRLLVLRKEENCVGGSHDKTRRQSAEEWIAEREQEKTRSGRQKRNPNTVFDRVLHRIAGWIQERRKR